MSGNRIVAYKGKDVDRPHRRPEFLNSFKSGIERGDGLVLLAQKLSNAYRISMKPWAVGELLSLIQWSVEHGHAHHDFVTWWSTRDENPQRWVTAPTSTATPLPPKDWKSEAEKALEALGNERRRTAKLERDIAQLGPRLETESLDRERVLRNELNAAKTKRAEAEHAQLKAEEAVAELQAEVETLKRSRLEAASLERALSGEQSEMSRLRAVNTKLRNENDALKAEVDEKQVALQRAISRSDEPSRVDRKIVTLPRAKGAAPAKPELAERLDWLVRECGMTAEQAIDFLRKAG